jgi:hybrid cluster-associated redox disulfide protein
MAIDPRFTVAEVMARYPRAGRVFFHHGMACVGCAMAPFDTLAEVAAVYGLDLRAFVAELGRLVGATRRARRTDGRTPGLSVRPGGSGGLPPPDRRRPSARREGE